MMKESDEGTSQGRIAIITGGSRGIGAAIGRRLAHDGMTVHLVYRNSDDAARHVLKNIESDGGRAFIHKADISDETQVRTLIAKIVEIERAVHVLVNNAAAIDDQLLMLMATAQWEHILRTNLTGPFLVCREVLPVMLDQEWGRIINISSNSARIPGPGQTAYAASKGGLEALTRGLATEVGRKGIRVNTVAPGKIRTEMTEAVADRLDSSEARWGLPEDVCGIVALLAGDEADYIQGQTITVDGGRLVMRSRGRQRPR